MILLVMLAGAGIVYLLVQRVYRKMWNKKLSAEIRFSTGHIVAGETIELVEVVSNKKRLPLPYIHLKFQVDRSFIFEDGNENAKISDMTYRNDIFSLLMHQRITRKIPVQCSKRGVYAIKKLDMVSTGIFMNEVLIVTNPVNAEIVVYPKSAATQQLEPAFSKLMGIVERNRRLYEDPFVFRGIRDYTSRDSLNLINWKASAKTGSFMVNQFNEAICQEVCILLNVEQEGMLRKDALSEASISIAASMAQMLIERGVSVSMVSNGADFASKEYISIEAASGQAHIGALNMALARIDLNCEPIDFKEILANDRNLVTKDASRLIASGFMGNENVIYVMISQNRRKDLQEAFDRLTGGRTDCMWIVPVERDERKALAYSNACQVDYDIFDMYI